MKTNGGREPAIQVDVNALRTNQVAIVTLVSLAFVIGGTPGGWVVGYVAAAMGIGAARPDWGPFQVLYRRLLKRSGLVRPAARLDDPAPHRFAQAVGAGVLTLAGLGLAAGWTALGWTLAWVVVTLALTNLLFDFCAGCFIFYQIARFRAARHPVEVSV